MKMNQFDVHGEMTQDERGKPQWPNYLVLNIRESEVWDLIHQMQKQIERNHYPDGDAKTPITLALFGKLSDYSE